jgi:hypothetical protein
MVLWSAAFLLAVAAQSRPRPLLIAGEPAWAATHIVIATKNKNTPGTIRVAHSLKGNLKTGDQIHLDALKAITEHDRLMLKAPTSAGLGSVPCSSIVLLVRKKGEISPWFASRLPRELVDDKDTDTWYPSGGKLTSSVAFLDGGKVYTVEALGKEIVVAPVWASEDEFLQRIARTVKSQVHLLNALQIPDDKARAHDLVGHLSFDSASKHEIEIAQEALAACGDAAVPALTSALMSAGGRPRLVMDLLEDRGNLGCQALCQRLKNDTALWKVDASALKRGWTDDTQNVNRKSGRIWRLKIDRDVVLSLGSSTLRGSVDESHRELALSTIDELASVWTANPVLSSEAPALLAECNEAADHLRQFGDPWP